MSTLEKTLPELIQELGITVKVNRIDTPEGATEWQERANAYRVTARYQGRSMSFNYFQGTGIKNDPIASDIIHCLSSELNILNSCDNFKCFVECFGLDIHSHQTYAHLIKQGKRYQRLIGDGDTLSRLLEMEY